MSSVKKRDFCKKKINFFKQEISKICKKIFIGSKTLEHIFSVQIPYYNESGLGFEKESEMKNDFSKVKERHGRPSNEFYKNYFGK